MVKIGKREVGNRHEKYISEVNEPDQYDGVDLTTLRPKMKRYIKHYMSTMNNAEACRSVGYNESTGWRLLKRDDVKAYMKWIMNEKSEAKIMSPTEVLERFTEIAERNAYDQVVTPKGDVIDKRIDVNTQISALNSLAKFHELLMPDTQVNQEFNIIVDITDAVEEPKEAEVIEEVEVIEEGDFNESEEDLGEDLEFLTNY